MLKGIDPVLSPELLKALAEMGHGDEIVLADANFTAQKLSLGKPVIRLPGIGMLRAVQALCSLFPLGDDVAQPVAFMHVSGEAKSYRSALQREVVGWLEDANLATLAQCEAMERFAFYERVLKAQLIVQTGELQPYANFIFKKGVLGEPLRP